MNKFSILLISAIFIAVVSTFCGFKQTNTNIMSYTNDNYDTEWRVIDSLDNEGLPKSALEKVKALYQRAKTDNNPAQIIKTVIYRGKYINQLEEDGFVKAINDFRTEMEAAKAPVKPILQSMLGELYATYMDNNHWRLRDRTTVTDFVLEDIQTWSLEQLSERSNALYRASLEDTQSQRVPIENFDAITKNNVPSDDQYRPTLYDFLAYRAIQHLSNQRNYLTEPAYKFYVNQPEALGTVSDFIKYDFTTRDSTSNKYQTLLIFQDILEFHQKSNNAAALIDADLHRLQFVKNEAVLPNKDALYLSALENLSENYQRDAVWTEVQYKIAQFYYQKGRQYQPNPDDTNKWELKKAHDICTQAIQKHPDSFGAKQCASLISQIETKDLQLTIEAVNMRDRAILALVAYKNIPKVFLKVAPISEKEKEKFQKLDRDDRADFLNDLQPLKIWAEVLPNDGDYQQHSVEIKLDALPAGDYVVLASDSEQFSTNEYQLSYMFTKVSDLAALFRAKGAKSEIVVVNRVSGEPMQGVEVEIFRRNYNPTFRKNEYKSIGTFTSDKNGMVAAKLDDRNNYKLHLSKGDDYLHLDENFGNYYRDYEPRVRTHTHFFLDRAIYRPSQTIYFKGLVVEIGKDQMPQILTNHKVTVTLRDANRQEVEKLDLITNEFGTVQGSFTAPAGGLTGRMSIESSSKGSHSFRVEEYKRPKFETTFRPIEGSYALGDQVTITGHAKALAGNNIDGAKVQYRVTRQARYPYLPWWYRRWYPPSPAMEITNGTTTTQADGTFEVTFDLLPDPSISRERKPQFSYQVYADVTDITGETQSAQTSISVGYVALNVGVSLPNEVSSNDLDSIAINTRNWSGQFEPAKGKVTIDLLRTPTQTYRQRLWKKPDQYILSETEFKKHFPFDAYKDEDEVQNWETLKNVYAENFDTAEKTAIRFGKKTWRPGKYRLRLSTQDKNGEAIEIEEVFTVYDLNAKALAIGDVYKLHLDKSKYEPSETASVSIGSFERNLHVLVDIYKKDKTDTPTWYQIRNLQQIQIPVTENDRGNFSIQTMFVKNNRVQTDRKTISVPWTNKQLQIEYATFRDKLYPGQEEEWQIKLSGTQKDQVTAEMVAAMYDASLDQFASNSWHLNLFPSNQVSVYRWKPFGFGSNRSSILNYDWNKSISAPNHEYRHLHWFEFPMYGYAFGGPPVLMESVVTGAAPRSKRNRMTEAAAPAMEAEAAIGLRGSRSDDADYYVDGVRISEGNIPPSESPAPDTDFSDVKVRTNLNETVFFFPNLRTDAEGNIIIKFTMNEALTKWKFLGLAHTKDLQVGTTEKEVVTQKDLMVVPNAPRFMREGDRIEFTAKVSNLTENALSGTAVLQLFDAVTMKPVDELLGNQKATLNFTAAAGQSDRLAWQLNIPKGKVPAITHRVIAKAGNFSDGEESSLPVLTNRMLVTETMPLPVRGKEEKQFTFNRMLDNTSNTLQHHRFALEFTSNPAWYAVQALPYLMEYPYECTEQIFNRLYANSLATSVANQHPKVQRIFNQWKNTDALLSNLSKNQELKSALLEETPWVLNAQSEAEQKKRIGLLFDLNRMSRELEVALQKINDRQLSNGGFPWFPGGRDNRYMTQYLVEGIGHLHKLGVFENINPRLSKDLLASTQKAVQYLDARMVEDYEELEKRVKEGKTTWDADHLSSIAIHYLYVRSFFLDASQLTAGTSTLIENAPQYAFNNKALEMYNYYLGQAEKHWLNKGIYQEGLLALGLQRGGKTTVPAKIIASLKERSLNNEELGMYWKYDRGYFWYQLPIETHALMIEAFAEVGDNPTEVEDLKVWLLKNKQTNHWKTTKATAAAVYALLSNGDNWLLDDQNIQISTGSRDLDKQIQDAQANAEAGTGYFKVDWTGDMVNKDMASVKVKNPNNVVAWGGMYWQYFEDMDKITHFEDTPLKLKKQVFIQKPSDRGPQLVPISDKTPLQVGDKLKVRIELRVDRTMEYVHMKDMRASGFEPINVLSEYKWQGGLGYYESTKDVSTNFFFSYLPKGTYVFEYPLWVAHEGDFSNGITTIQCMYAPEFTSHSEGIRVAVE